MMEDSWWSFEGFWTACQQGNHGSRSCFFLGVPFWYQSCDPQSCDPHFIGPLWSPVVPSHDLSRSSRPASACCCCMHCGCLRPRLVDSLLGGRDEMFNQWVHAKPSLILVGHGQKPSETTKWAQLKQRVVGTNHGDFGTWMKPKISSGAGPLRIYMGSRGITKFLIKLIVKKAHRANDGGFTLW